MSRQIFDNTTFIRQRIDKLEDRLDEIEKRFSLIRDLFILSEPSPFSFYTGTTNQQESKMPKAKKAKSKKTKKTSTKKK